MNFCNTTCISPSTTKHIEYLSKAITIAWNWKVKGWNQSPDFERDLYDLGQDHGGTRRAAELLKYIFDHWQRPNAQEKMLFKRGIKSFKCKRMQWRWLVGDQNFCAITVVSGFKTDWESRIIAGIGGFCSPRGLPTVYFAAIINFTPTVI